MKEMSRFQVRVRYFEDKITFSIWDNKENDWHLSKCGYIKGTKEEMQRMCNYLNCRDKEKAK